MIGGREWTAAAARIALQSRSSKAAAAIGGMRPRMTFDPPPDPEVLAAAVRVVRALLPPSRLRTLNFIARARGNAVP